MSCNTNERLCAKGDTGTRVAKVRAMLVPQHKVSTRAGEQVARCASQGSPSGTSGSAVPPLMTRCTIDETRSFSAGSGRFSFVRKRSSTIMSAASCRGVNLGGKTLKLRTTTNVSLQRLELQGTTPSSIVYM